MYKPKKAPVMKIAILGFGAFMVILGLSLLTSPIIPEFPGEEKPVYLRITCNVWPPDKNANYEYSKAWTCSADWEKDSDPLFYIPGNIHEDKLTENVADHFEVEVSQVECVQAGGGETAKDWKFKINVITSDSGIGGSTQGHETQIIGLMFVLMGGVAVVLGFQFKEGER